MKKNVKDELTFCVASNSDADVICHLLSMAFGFSRARALEYVGHVGTGSFRLVKDGDGAIIACAALLLTSHAIGGVDVPAANIAHVSIAPEARGRGLARPIVEALCQDAREQGALMVSLYASVRPVYRKCGFELAGSEIVYEADTASLPIGTPAIFRPLEPTDQRIVRAYAAKRRMEAGLLCRADVHWKEIVRAPTDALAAYGVNASQGSELDAYVIVDASSPQMLELRDWYATDGRMAEALLCFMARFASVYPRVRWHGGPQDELVAAMPNKGWRLVHQEEWLARILEPAEALACRGYAMRDGSLGLRILSNVDGDTDLTLQLANRVARVEPGLKDGTPFVAIEKPFLASLFTGFASASMLMRRGHLSGPPEAVQLCDLVFAGPRPWAAEHF